MLNRLLLILFILLGFTSSMHAQVLSNIFSGRADVLEVDFSKVEVAAGEKRFATEDLTYAFAYGGAGTQVVFYEDVDYLVVGNMKMKELLKKKGANQYSGVIFEIEYASYMGGQEVIREKEVVVYDYSTYDWKDEISFYHFVNDVPHKVSLKYEAKLFFDFTED